MIAFAYIIFAVSVAALGGFLFGYDTAVISGAIGYLKTYFDLTPMQTGWAGASAIIGCIPGAMVGGMLSDRFGRKRVLILSARIVFHISSVVRPGRHLHNIHCGPFHWGTGDRHLFDDLPHLHCRDRAGETSRPSRNAVSAGDCRRDLHCLLCQHADPTGGFRTMELECGLAMDARL